ncbi:MAG: hypothetical protein SFX73_13675 [Kofleriaceae bacterium]|nr:hypothetical protein [Kofleriaceae bacterium]
MRVEERQVDGDELEQERKREKSPLEVKRTTDLAEVGDAMRRVEHKRHDALLGVMRSILEDRSIALNTLRLPQRELRALEAMRVAVTGKSADTHQFVYAEDRRAMLEQALAVLQPDLTSHDTAQLQNELTALTVKVTELRETLLELEDGQDELVGVAAEKKKAEEADSDDKPDDADEDDKESTLYGPEREEEKKPATTLTGPEVKQEKAPTTLTGAERKEPPAQPTTLGDASEIAAAARKTWWQP